MDKKIVTVISIEQMLYSMGYHYFSKSDKITMSCYIYKKIVNLEKLYGTLFHRCEIKFDHNLKNEVCISYPSGDTVMIILEYNFIINDDILMIQ